MDDKERLKQRKKRQSKKRRKKAGKTFILVISIIVLAAAAFLITMKICDPNFEIKSIIPQEKLLQVVQLVREDVFKQTTTEAVTTTTKPTTTKPSKYDYVEFDDFAFDTSLQGNQVGNLLNDSLGTVTYSSSYIYYSIVNKGIFKFEPNQEGNSKLLGGDYNFIYLNVLGDYLYAVNADNNKLVKIDVSSGDNMAVADGVSFIYLYSDKLYYIGTDNTIGYIDTKDYNKTVLYSVSQADKIISFAGISLSRVFFELYDPVAVRTEYLTVSIKNKNDVARFREDSLNNEILNLCFEGGFMYFYQKQSDGSFNLCRQKFGSEQIVTLNTNCTVTDYPVVCSNRLYYTDLEGGKMRAKELNMNTDERKIMVTVSNADKNDNLAVGFGYQYIFLRGCKSGINGVPNDDFVFKGSCIYTSASGDNTLTFKDGKLSY